VVAADIGLLIQQTFKGRGAPREDRDSMTFHERRKYVRVNRQFTTLLSSAEGKHETTGTTENISQGGVYIKTRNWRTFRTGDQTTITLFLPPSFTDKEKTLGLRGNAIVRRIDFRNQAIALEFYKNLQDFEKLIDVEIAGEYRYKKVSHFLHCISESEFADFLRCKPHGFLVHTSAEILRDKDVFQFSTLSLDDDYAMREVKRDMSIGSIREARVIEVEKKTLDRAKNTITIGRAPTNDIVLRDALVSKTHAYLYIHASDKNCYLVDCASKNGTLLNGKTLKAHEKNKIVNCDEICFGPQTKTIYFSTIGFADFINQFKTALPA
jgi:hypothetical protein